MAAVAQPPRDREVGEMISRMTTEGRKLTYVLRVIQQPERARACGSGAKSSADRRPVDPPPVVELRIFEGDAKTGKDITFAYNANFFLFATLELARPVAHGRGQSQPAQIPVLTGMPVSGMAYLDRPSEAGYFIFPDLSVRHEGKYKLSFNLYEETKESKDGDAEPGDNQPAVPAGLFANGSFDFRLEVKSDPFTVYSAKKFPGLAESTMLSRTVAEQGCRVRIRRDVRMRRRDGKASEEFNEFDEEYSRVARRSATPSSIHDVYSRQRSLSNASVDRQSYIQERRSSGVEPSQQPYPAAYAHSPLAPQSATGGYLSFGSSSAPQYQAPQFAQPQPPSRPVQQQQQPPYPEQSNWNYSESVMYRHQPAPYQYSDRQPYPQPYGSQRSGYDTGDFRRPSATYTSVPAPSSSATQYAHVDQGYSRNGSTAPYQQYPPRSHTPVSQTPVNLAPLKMPAMEPKYESKSSPVVPLSAPSRMVVPHQLPSPGYQDRSTGYGNFTGSAPTPAVSELTRNAKRPFDSVFNSSSLHQPLHNGMRPTSSHHAQSAAFDDDDEADNLEALRMQYKRADGSSYSRELPTLE
ncbi:MAG: velvet protein [Claussenomyces sp. TS43310]|nr:MAG: velvet protein [Claussenomyces sp. TS43310]